LTKISHTILIFPQCSLIVTLIVSAQIAPVLLTTIVTHSSHTHTVVPRWPGTAAQ